YSGVAKTPASATHVLDPRLKTLAALIPGIFTAKHCLDVGCNGGSVSTQLAFDFHAASVTGVDIDPQLVGQAEKLFALRASRARPPTTAQAPAHVVDYFPMSAVLSHGYRIEPESRVSRNASTASARWPRVNFYSADWAVPTAQDVAEDYHVILALSVIKWIHLEHADQGLIAFFAKCSASLKSGGHFIIELQGWDSYQKAVRPNHAPHFQQALDKLELRPETSFDKLLQDQGLHLCASSDALPRRISVYRKV
ncbi:Bin3 family protein, partial [Pyrenophora tritici-repentis]